VLDERMIDDGNALHDGLARVLRSFKFKPVFAL
jgi:hypothetical protein